MSTKVTKAEEQKQQLSEDQQNVTKEVTKEVETLEARTPELAKAEERSPNSKEEINPESAVAEKESSALQKRMTPELEAELKGIAEKLKQSDRVVDDKQAAEHNSLPEKVREESKGRS